jgi:hypothetical protein
MYPARLRGPAIAAHPIAGPNPYQAGRPKKAAGLSFVRLGEGARKRGRRRYARGPF